MYGDYREPCGERWKSGIVISAARVWLFAREFPPHSFLLFSLVLLFLRTKSPPIFSVHHLSPSARPRPPSLSPSFDWDLYFLSSKRSRRKKKKKRYYGPWDIISESRSDRRKNSHLKLGKRFLIFFFLKKKSKINFHHDEKNP